MAYKIVVSPRAQKEVIKTIDYYLERSEDAPGNFITQLEKNYAILTENPFFRLQYKNIRSLKLKKFPYSLYFTINEKTQVVHIIACFHNKLNPKKRP
ncbi:MAG: type II toxin-antitoxin system RelE/ParE family toxin [Flavobacterium sp.]